MRRDHSGAGRRRNRESNVIILFLGRTERMHHSQTVFIRLIYALILLLAATTASALTIVGYDSATNDRFSSGYASSPVENTSLSFLGNGYDLSGVGWSSTDSTRSFAMISDQYFVFANHHAPGAAMNFYSPTLDTVVSYGVSNTYNFTYNGQTSDFAVGRLVSALNPAHGITSYPILYAPTLESYLGLPVLMYGNGVGGPRLGANVVDLYGSYSLNGGTLNNIGIGYSYNSSLSGDSVLQSGDSSSPTFVPWNGALTLVGTHSGVAQDSSYSVDNFIPYYLLQMINQGIPFSYVVVPEPSRAMLLLLGACTLLRRRHRAPRE